MSVRNVTVNAGQSGSGKSSLAIRYLLNARLAYRFLFDADAGEKQRDVGEFAARLRLEPARDELGLAESLCRGWVAFEPWAMFPGNPESALDWFCRWAFELCARLPGEKIIVIDEIWKYCSPNAIPFPLARIVKEGRKRGLRLLVNIQEPHRLNGRIAAEMSELICFRLTLPRALDFAEEYGFDRAEVAALAPMHCIARNLDTGGELRGQVKL